MMTFGEWYGNLSDDEIAAATWVDRDKLESDMTWMEYMEQVAYPAYCEEEASDESYQAELDYMRRNPL